MSFLSGALCYRAPFGNLVLLSGRSLSQGKSPMLMTSSLRPSRCKPQLSCMTHDGRKIHSLGAQAGPTLTIDAVLPCNLGTSRQRRNPFSLQALEL